MVFRRIMPSRQNGPCLLVAICLALLPLGCRTAHSVRDSEHDELVHRMMQAWSDPQPQVAALAPVAHQLAGPQPVETYIAYALGQNPDIQAARKRVEAQAQRVPQAASLEDPMLEVNPFADPMMMGPGMQQVFQLGAGQRLPWFGKLRTRAEIAEMEVDVARAELSATELTVIEQVKRAYYELYFLEQAITVTRADRELLLDLEQIAEIRFRVGEVSQADLLRSQLEIYQLDSELLRLRQQLQSGQARLARLLHISPDTPLRALPQLPQEQIPRDLQRLYEQAIAARPELHAQLAAVMRDRSSIDLAQLDYFPDVTLSGMWMAMEMVDAAPFPAPNGGDAFMIGVGVNLPIYRKRLDAAVREAEARAVSSSRQYDSLRDQTLEEVKDLFEQVRSQQELVQLFREEIIPRADQTLRVSLRAYEVGDVSFLTLIDNWRQLLRFQINYARLEAQLRQSLASLERIVGGQ